MRTYQLLGYINLALVVLITAPYWLRMLNQKILKTRDKWLLNLIKLLRRLHKPLAAALVAITLWHGWLAWGSLRLHTGLLTGFAFLLTAMLGIAFWLRKNKRAFKGHKVMALISVLLLALHLLYPSALWYWFGL